MSSGKNDSSEGLPSDSEASQVAATEFPYLKLADELQLSVIKAALPGPRAVKIKILLNIRTKPKYFNSLRLDVSDYYASHPSLSISLLRTSFSLRKTALGEGYRLLTEFQLTKPFYFNKDKDVLYFEEREVFNQYRTYFRRDPITHQRMPLEHGKIKYVAFRDTHGDWGSAPGTAAPAPIVLGSIFTHTINRMYGDVQAAILIFKTLEEVFIIMDPKKLEGFGHGFEKWFVGLFEEKKRAMKERLRRKEISKATNWMWDFGSLGGLDVNKMPKITCLLQEDFEARFDLK